MPPNLDTSAASTLNRAPCLSLLTDHHTDRSFAGQGQLTPVSLSSGSRGESPKTPNGRLGGGRPEDYFAPRIANDSPTSQTPRRPGGYGGFGEPEGYDAEPLYPVNTPNKQTSNVLQRMDTIAPGPFDTGRRPSATGTAFPASPSPNDYERPGTSMSNMSSSLGSMRVPRAPRNDGYGGFGPPQRSYTDVEPKAFGLTQRSDTFPRPSDPMTEAPARTPSAPGPRPDRLRRPSEEDVDMMPMMGDRLRRPSKDTSRPPPPRTSVVRSKTTGSSYGSVNIAAEFGVGNPYHAATDSMSSSYSASTQRSGKPSQSSLASSPPRSVASRFDRRPSNASVFGNGNGTEERTPKELPKSPIQPPPFDKPFASVLAKRPPRPDRGGYDPRIAPAQKSGPDQALSPLTSPAYELASPAYDMSTRDDPAIQDPRENRPPPPPVPVSPRVASPERMKPRSRSRSQPRDPAVQARSRSRPREQVAPPAPREPTPPREPLQPREPAVKPRSRSRPRDPTVPSSRGDCKSCKLPITGKSISSADGRLTGRYHKACFVCTTCHEPFSSATFYVHDDKPYCEIHYHKLNGSLCGGCGNGIEGQYLEDERTRKHHPGCFRCGDCGMVLKDGYFEVNGKAFCEKDAWRRVQQPQPWMRPPGRKGSAPNLGMPASNLGLPPRGPGGMRSGSFGLPNPYSNPNPRGGRFAGGPPPIARMEKRMTRLGMM